MRTYEYLALIITARTLMPSLKRPVSVPKAGVIPDEFIPSSFDLILAAILITFSTYTRTDITF